jgi:hypothetical protein
MDSLTRCYSRPRHPSAVCQGHKFRVAGAARELGPQVGRALMSFLSGLNIVQAYERGVYTRRETVSRLILAAAGLPPEVIVGDLDASWLAELRAETNSPPARLDDIFWLQSVCAGPGHDQTAHQAEMKRLYFDGVWQWHRYFASEPA